MLPNFVVFSLEWIEMIDELPTTSVESLQLVCVRIAVILLVVFENVEADRLVGEARAAADRMVDEHLRSGIG
jgi:hypothetical protein